MKTMHGLAFILSIAAINGAYANSEAIEGIHKRLEALEQQSETKANADQTSDDTYPQHSYTPYGWLRIGAGSNTPEWDVGDAGSRVGVMGRSQVLEDLAAIGRIEFGINTASSVDTDLIVISVNSQVLETEHDVFLRLGWAGLDSKWGSITFGKSWSAYYDVTAATDWFWVFGGEGSGTYNVGDGGGSGTGRAEKVVQFRTDFKPFQFTAQYQPRSDMDIITNTAADDKPQYAGAFGVSGRWTFAEKWALGLGYNRAHTHSSKYSGGIGHESDPNSLAALYDISGDDEATALSFTYGAHSDSTYIAVVGGIYQDHLVAPVARRSDGTNLRKAVISGKGWEVYAHHNVTDDIRIFGGTNFTRPQRSEMNEGNVAPGSEFEVFLYGAAYNTSHQTLKAHCSLNLSATIVKKTTLLLTNKIETS